MEDRGRHKGWHRLRARFGTNDDRPCPSAGRGGNLAAGIRGATFYAMNDVAPRLAARRGACAVRRGSQVRGRRSGGNVLRVAAARVHRARSRSSNSRVLITATTIIRFTGSSPRAASTILCHSRISPDSTRRQRDDFHRSVQRHRDHAPTGCVGRRSPRRNHC